jgi:hypothetical protein
MQIRHRAIKVVEVQIQINLAKVLGSPRETQATLFPPESTSHTPFPRCSTHHVPPNLYRLVPVSPKVEIESQIQTEIDTREVLAVEMGRRRVVM